MLNDLKINNKIKNIFNKAFTWILNKIDGDSYVPEILIEVSDVLNKISGYKYSRIIVDNITNEYYLQVLFKCPNKEQYLPFNIYYNAINKNYIFRWENKLLREGLQVCETYNMFYNLNDECKKMFLMTIIDKLFNYQMHRNNKKYYENFWKYE